MSLGWHHEHERKRSGMGKFGECVRGIASATRRPRPANVIDLMNK